MSNKYREFENLIKEISEKENLTEGQISIAAGRNSGYIAQIRSRFLNEKKEIPDKFMESLRLRFAITSSIAGYTSKEFEKNKFHISDDMSAQTISDLARSNIILSESIKVQSETTKVLADNNKNLLNRLPVTAGAALENSSNQPDPLLGFLNTLVRGGIGSLWKSEAEGLELLGKMFVEGAKVKQE